MYTKKTLTELQQSVADRHDSGVIPTSSVTLSFWARLLNRGQAYLADRLRLEKKEDYTTVNGTIALADDFLVIHRVYEGDDEYTQVDKDDTDHQIGSVYWITGNHYSGFSINTPSDVTVTAYYSFKVAEMVSGTDECIIPDPEAVVAYAYGMLRKSETDPIEDANESLAEADRRLAEMQSVQTINDNFNGLSWN